MLSKQDDISCDLKRRACHQKLNQSVINYNQTFRAKKTRV